MGAVVFYNLILMWHIITSAICYWSHRPTLVREDWTVVSIPEERVHWWLPCRLTTKNSNDSLESWTNFHAYYLNLYSDIIYFFYKMMNNVCIVCHVLWRKRYFAIFTLNLKADLDKFVIRIIFWFFFNSFNFIWCLINAMLKQLSS